MEKEHELDEAVKEVLHALYVADFAERIWKRALELNQDEQFCIVNHTLDELASGKSAHEIAWEIISVGLKKGSKQNPYFAELKDRFSDELQECHP